MLSAGQQNDEQHQKQMKRRIFIFIKKRFFTIKNHYIINIGYWLPFLQNNGGALALMCSETDGGVKGGKYKMRNF